MGFYWHVNSIKFFTPYMVDSKKLPFKISLSFSRNIQMKAFKKGIIDMNKEIILKKNERKLIILTILPLSMMILIAKKGKN